MKSKDSVVSLTWLQLWPINGTCDTFQMPLAVCLLSASGVGVDHSWFLDFYRLWPENTEASTSPKKWRPSGSTLTTPTHGKSLSTPAPVTRRSKSLTQMWPRGLSNKPWSWPFTPNPASLPLTLSSSAQGLMCFFVCSFLRWFSSTVSSCSRLWECWSLSCLSWAQTWDVPYKGHLLLYEKGSWTNPKLLPSGSMKVPRVKSAEIPRIHLFMVNCFCSRKCGWMSDRSRQTRYQSLSRMCSRSSDLLADSACREMSQAALSWRWIKTVAWVNYHANTEKLVLFCLLAHEDT